MAVLRSTLLLLIAITLAGCGKDNGKAFLDSRTPPALGPRFWKPDGWAWGVVRVSGAPEIRYGVSAPAGPPSPRVVVIATGYGESAEVYYETARDLNARGWAVWVIESHGQGGSGRFPGSRDIGRSAGFDKDATAIRSLLDNVVRPARGDEVVLAAHGTAAYGALQAAEAGLRQVDRLVIWSADLTAPANPETAARMTRLGLGGLRATGGPWRRPAVNIAGRATLPLAWSVANPDLRMGGPGWSYLDARARADAVRRAEKLEIPTEFRGPVATPVHCRSGCRWTRAPQDEHLGDDATRRGWLEALAGPDSAPETDHAQ